VLSPPYYFIHTSPVFFFTSRMTLSLGLIAKAANSRHRFTLTHTYFCDERKKNLKWER